MVHPWDKGENIHLDNFLFSVVHMRELELADKEWALDDSFGPFGSKTVFSKLSYNTFPTGTIEAFLPLDHCICYSLCLEHTSLFTSPSSSLHLAYLSHHKS